MLVLAYSSACCLFGKSYGQPKFLLGKAALETSFPQPRRERGATIISLSGIIHTQQ